MNRLFDERDGLRSEEQELLEAVLLTAANTYEERKLPYLAHLGATACVFGPGDIRVAHRTGEFVPVAELMRASEILAAAVDRFART